MVVRRAIDVVQEHARVARVDEQAASLERQVIVPDEVLGGRHEQWVHLDVPVGAGVGRVFKVGKQPINMSVHGYYNAIKPEIGGEELMGDWTIRTQVQFLIPTMAKK